MSAQRAEHPRVSDDDDCQTDDDSECSSYSSEEESIMQHGGTQMVRDEDHPVLNEDCYPEANDSARPSALAEQESDIGDSESYADDWESFESDMTISTDVKDWDDEAVRGRRLHRLWDSMARSVSFLGTRSWSLSPSRMRSQGLDSFTIDDGAGAAPWSRRSVKHEEEERSASYSRIEQRKLPLNAERDRSHVDSCSEDDSGSVAGADDVEPDERLCETCRGINAEVLASGYDHLPLGELRESADACRLCQRLKHKILGSTLNLSFRDRYTTVLSCEHLVIKDSWTRRLVRLDFPYFTNEGDPAVHYGVHSRPRLTTTKSEKSFETARTWLHECLECKGNHAVVGERPDFLSNWFEGSGDMIESSSSGASSQDEISPRGAVEQPSERPSRLIDIHPENAGPGVIKLVPSLSGSYQYMTLSYCWGKHPDPAWITTRQNVQRRLESFSTSELPATLFDAVTIADRLGARYLWIDALCIVQDDVGEWEFEGGRMAGIYRGAALCIAASSSTSSVDGIFNKRSSSLFEKFVGRIIRIDDTLTTLETKESSERVKSSLYFHDDSEFMDMFASLKGPLQQHIEHGPLSERAWVLQERLLSPRILHYTREQLVWQCEHCLMLEDQLLRNPEDLRSFKHEVLSILICRLDSTEVRNFWYYDIVEAYTRRKLTYGSDKLIAISALARAVCNNYPDVYLAGLWRESLIQGLLWYRRGPGCKSGEYRAPSWSWASQDSAVLFQFWQAGYVSDCIAIESDVKTEGINAMGKVLGGFITLRARAMEGVVMRIFHDIYDPQLVLWDGKRPCTCFAYMDNDDIKVKTVVCILIGGMMGLLLRPVASEAGVYERVGLISILTGQDYDYRHDFVSSWPWRTITVK